MSSMLGKSQNQLIHSARGHAVAGGGCVMAEVLRAGLGQQPPGRLRAFWWEQPASGVSRRASATLTAISVVFCTYSCDYYK